MSDVFDFHPVLLCAATVPVTKVHSGLALRSAHCISPHDGVKASAHLLQDRQTLLIS